jgi:hypothetical protein
MLNVTTHFKRESNACVEYITINPATKTTKARK